MSDTNVLFEGKYLRLVRRGHWEYAERTNTSGAVLIVALTDEQELVLVEQYRVPHQARVIELPAGLAGDIPGQEEEAMATAAERELLEETGFRAGGMSRITSGPTSAGLSTEMVTFFRATELERINAGGGDASEDIVVHAVPLADAASWLNAQMQNGVLVDPKVFAGILFAGARSD